MYAYVCDIDVLTCLIRAYYIEPLKRVFVSLGLVTFYMFMPKHQHCDYQKSFCMTLYLDISCSYGIIIIQDA